ncbi:WAS/WASL-interacting protein family member 1-like [Empidonax traillii]|uniref:WAS/WASL-interacting protein family member 1-like n=1 Tax=Empidonax traillii TaxID=164674 RepID=UPI000FFD55B0|nr:WAS/WASL-interacting protein family member 1-like [Empidonax traillii]
MGLQGGLSGERRRNAIGRRQPRPPPPARPSALPPTPRSSPGPPPAPLPPVPSAQAAQTVWGARARMGDRVHLAKPRCCPSPPVGTRRGAGVARRGRQVLRTRPPELPGARVRGGRPLNTHPPLPPPHTRVYRRSRSERRRGQSGPRSPRLPAPRSSPLSPPPCSSCLPPLPPLPRFHRARRGSAGGGGVSLVYGGPARSSPGGPRPGINGSLSLPALGGSRIPARLGNGAGKPPFAHAQEENRGWGHANIHPRFLVPPVSAVGTRFHLSSCEEAEATGFACKAEGKNKQHNNSNKQTRKKNTKVMRRLRLSLCGAAAERSSCSRRSRRRGRPQPAPLPPLCSILPEILRGLGHNNPLRNQHL